MMNSTPQSNIRPTLSSDCLISNKQVMAGSAEHKVYAELSEKLEPMGMKASLRSLLSIDTIADKQPERLFNQYEFSQDVRRRLGSEVSILQASAAQIKPFTDKAHQREQKYLAFQSVLISRVLDNMNEAGQWKDGSNPFPLTPISEVIPALKEDTNAYGNEIVKSCDVYFDGSVAEMAEKFRAKLATKERGTDPQTGERCWRSESGLMVAPMKTWCVMSQLKHQLMRTMPLVLLERKDGTSIEGKIYADYLDSNISNLKSQLGAIMKQVFQAAGMDSQEINDLLGQGSKNESEQVTAAGRRHNALNNLFDNALTAIATDWYQRDTQANQQPQENFSAQINKALEQLEPFVDTTIKAQMIDALTDILSNTSRLSTLKESRPRLVETASEHQSQAYIAKSHFDLPGRAGHWNLEVPQKVLEQYDIHPLSEPNVTQLSATEKQGPEKPLVFILDPDGNIKLCRHKDTHYHHSTPDGGRPNMTAGEMLGFFHGSESGKVFFQSTEIKNKSGHFWPTIDSLEQLKDTLVRSGMNPSTVRWIAEQSPTEVKQIVDTWTSDEPQRIPGSYSLAKADKDNLKEATSYLERAMVVQPMPSRLSASKSDPQLTLRTLGMKKSGVESALEKISEKQTPPPADRKEAA